MGETKLRLNRLENEFDDIDVKAATPAQTQSSGDSENGSLNNESRFDTPLIPKAWGDELPGRYRLVIRGIRMASGPAKADVSLALFFNGQTIELKQGMGEAGAAGWACSGGFESERGSGRGVLLPGFWLGTARNRHGEDNLARRYFRGIF